MSSFHLYVVVVGVECEMNGRGVDMTFVWNETSDSFEAAYIVSIKLAHCEVLTQNKWYEID